MLHGLMKNHQHEFALLYGVLFRYVHREIRITWRKNPMRKMLLLLTVTTALGTPALAHPGHGSGTLHYVLEPSHGLFLVLAFAAMLAFARHARTPRRARQSVR